MTAMEITGVLLFIWVCGVGAGVLGVLAGQMLRGSRAATEADEAEFKDKLADTREHQDAHGAGVTPLRSRVVAGLRAARLRVAREVAAVREDLARLRARMVVQPMDELESSTRTWLERDRKSDETWPMVNAAPAPVVEPVADRQDPAAFLREARERQRLVQERSEAELLNGATTGLMPRIKEPVAS